MKKLIAISVLFALLATAVFAETSVGGNMKISTSLLKGQSGNPADTGAGTNPDAGSLVFWDGHVNVNFGDAKAGGMMRLWTKTNEWQPDWFAFWWWRPNEYFRMQLGKNPDGDWGTAQITGWGYNAEAQGGIVYDQHRGANGTASIVARTAGFAPGVEGPSLNLSGYLLDNALTLNLHIPFGGAGAHYYGDTSDAAGKEWQSIYSKMYANIIYKLEDVGDVFLTAQFAPGSQDRFDPRKDADDLAKGKKPDYRWRGNDEAHETTKLWASFYLTAIDDMALELGFGYQLPFTTQYAKWVDTDGDGIVDTNVGGEGFGGLPQGAVKNYPLEIGLGYRFSSGDFAIKVRTGATLGGSQKLTNESKAREAVERNPGQTSLYLLSSSGREIVNAPAGSAPGVTKVIRPYSGTTAQINDDFEWGFGILPSYKVGAATVFLNAGFGIKASGTAEITYVEDGVTKKKIVSHNTRVVAKDAVISKQSAYEKQENELSGISILDSSFDWFINPYVSVPAGSGRFYAGFKLYADGTKVPQKFAWNREMADLGKAGATTGRTTNIDVVKWEIPIGWNFYF